MTACITISPLGKKGKKTSSRKRNHEKRVVVEQQTNRVIHLPFHLSLGTLVRNYSLLEIVGCHYVGRVPFISIEREREI